MMRLPGLVILLLSFSTSLAEWSPCGPECLQHVYSFAVAPGDPNVVLVVGSLGSIDETGAWRTENGGKSWRPLFLDESDSLLPGALFITRSTQANYASVGLDLYESRDGGRTWRRIGTVTDPEFPLEQVSLFSLDVTSDEIVAGLGNQRPRQSGGLFHSSDAGRTWKAYPELFGRTVYDILVIDDETILVATDQRVHRTTDGGRTWKEVGPAGVEARVRDLARDPRSGALYAGTSGRGVWRSTNGGNSWIARSAGMKSPATYSVAVDPSQHGVVWAGASGGGLYRTSNDGETWSQSGEIGARTMVSRIHFPESKPELGIIATGDGLYCRAQPASTERE